MFRNDPMNDVPLTGLACPVEVLQGGLAMHIVQTPIHDAPNQTFKGMVGGFAAPDARVRHGSLLAVRDTYPKSFYCSVYSLLVNYDIFLSMKGIHLTKMTAPASGMYPASTATTPPWP